MEKFSTRLKNAMRTNDITPINLSRKTGIPKSSISQYVNGKATPKADRIYKLSVALDVSESWLLGHLAR